MVSPVVAPMPEYVTVVVDRGKLIRLPAMHVHAHYLERSSLQRRLCNDDPVFSERSVDHWCFTSYVGAKACAALGYIVGAHAGSDQFLLLVRLVLLLLRQRALNGSKSFFSSFANARR